jgi:hypothetical protein
LLWQTKLFTVPPHQSRSGAFAATMPGCSGMQSLIRGSRHRARWVTPHATRRRKLRLGHTSVTARVGFGPDDAGCFRLSVELDARVPELDAGTAREIAEAADRACPYSNAVRGNVKVALVIDPEPEVI